MLKIGSKFGIWSKYFMQFHLVFRFIQIESNRRRGNSRLWQVICIFLTERDGGNLDLLSYEQVTNDTNRTQNLTKGLSENTQEINTRYLVIDLYEPKFSLTVKKLTFRHEPIAECTMKVFFELCHIPGLSILKINQTSRWCCPRPDLVKTVWNETRKRYIRKVKIYTKEPSFFELLPKQEKIEPQIHPFLVTWTGIFCAFEHELWRWTLGPRFMCSLFWSDSPRSLQAL